MNRFFKHIAVLLLLLFVRVMVPDALLLKLHEHGHTEHTVQTDAHKAEIGEKHIHCPVEDLFGAPYQMAGGPVFSEPIAHAAAYTVNYTSNRYGTTHYNTSLRGPPLS